MKIKVSLSRTYQHACHVTWSICDQKVHRNTMVTGRLKIRKAKPIIKTRVIKTSVIIIIQKKKNLPTIYWILTGAKNSLGGTVLWAVFAGYGRAECSRAQLRPPCMCLLQLRGPVGLWSGASQRDSVSGHSLSPSSQSPRPKHPQWCRKPEEKPELLFAFHWKRI